MNTHPELVRPNAIAKKIVSLLEEAQKPLTFKFIQDTIEVDTTRLESTISMMLQDEQLKSPRKSTYELTDSYKVVTGRVKSKREGHGILKTASGREVSISPRQMDMAWDGDLLEVELGSKVFFGKPEGIILNIVERAHSRITGRFTLSSDGTGHILPDNPKLQSILIPDHKKARAKNNDHIVVEITQYPESHMPAHGKIIENFGQADNPYVQTQLAITKHHLPFEFSKEVQQQAQALQRPTEDDTLTRVDLRELPLMTIDGESARDFDDAVFACRKPRGGWRLWVAIADVSHYVPKDSPLDLEARDRGTSVYFPHKVIPMLPEALSNDLCSLKPHVDRLALICEMAVSASGKVTKYVFYEGIIRSHARLTYNQVGAFLSGTEYENRDQKTIGEEYPNLCEPLLDLYEVYQKLFEARRERGALEFSTTETEFKFDFDGHIEDVVPVYRNDAHKLVEEIMLAANVCAAKVIEKHEIPSFYRNHEPPVADRLESLVSSLQAFGVKPSFSNAPEPKDFMHFLEQVEARPDGHILQTLMLRSLSQAKYETECKGHFGLAYQTYTHFTSPIRRYPDLVVHRTIRYLIRNQKGNHLHRVKGAKKLRKPEWIFEKQNVLEDVAKHSSECERRADDATRDVVAWLKCAYMKQHLGSMHDGQISGVTHFGLFVTINELMIDGLIHISNLDHDYYTYDESTARLVGERSGFVYKIGDPIRIKVAQVSLEDRKIDFLPAKTQQSSSSRKKSKKRKK
ncbi:MAG: ribonuclease R [Gammaproteobacteria bacterium]|nr:ribonuclease R [Gammaproteobacteria bacterium]|tara:strand:+ start:2485 stop:4716 length:2232 start_codon:yes stop_codon:yes gene_type:complete